MQIWKRISELTISKLLRLGEHALIRVVRGGKERDVVLGGMVISLSASQALTVKDHAGGRTLKLDGSGSALTYTLPKATGSGAQLTFIVGTVNTSGHVIEVADSTDVMRGNIWANSTGDTPDLAQPWPTAAGSDTITLNGTTTGGQAVGDRIDLIDIAPGVWQVLGFTTCSGTEATPFSDDV